MLGYTVDFALATLNFLDSNQNESFASPPAINKSKDVRQQFGFFGFSCFGKGVLVPLEIKRRSFFLVKQLLDEFTLPLPASVETL